LRRSAKNPKRWADAESRPSKNEGGAPPIPHRQSYLPKIATLHSNARVAQTLEYLALLDKLVEKGFEIQFESHAAAILEKDFPEALTDLEQALGTLTIPITEIIGSGGGETKGTQRMRRAFNNVGWHKFIFEIRKIINGTEREAISHEIDHVKDFGKYKLALEIEWNNKEGRFWGRDLNGSRIAHKIGEIKLDGENTMMSGTAKDSKLPTPGFKVRKPRRTHMFRNYYRCPYDGAAWIDEWSCMCNDRCPMCRAEIEPYDSEDVWVLSRAKTKRPNEPSMLP